MNEQANFSALSNSVQKTNLLLKDIERRFGWEKRPDQAYAGLRTVLQTLRDRLPVNEAARNADPRSYAFTRRVHRKRRTKRCKGRFAGRNRRHPAVIGFEALS